MGNRRMGLGRMEALLEAIDRELTLTDSTIKNAAYIGFTKATATSDVTAAMSGRTILVGPAAAGLAGHIVLSLPTAADGLFYRFVYVGGAADGQNFQINTGSDTNFFIGGTIQHDIGATADNIATHPDLNSNSKINILTPDAGTYFECYCDGTNWFYSGYVNSATNAAVTFADQ